MTEYAPQPQPAQKQKESSSIPSWAYQAPSPKPYSPRDGVLSLPNAEPVPEEILAYYRGGYMQPLALVLKEGMGHYQLRDRTGRSLYVSINHLKGLFSSLDGMGISRLKHAYEKNPMAGVTFYDRVSGLISTPVALHMQTVMGHKEMLGDLQLTDNQLSADAFVEQLTNRSSYMNEADLDSTNQDIGPQTEKKKSNFQGKNLLDYFGFDSELPVFGEWGFQMRVFTPRPEARLKDDHAIARRKALNLDMPILVFRGTEGIQFNTSEGGVDTMVGDTARASVGFLQYKMNQERIEGAINPIKSGIFAGHSLGGGIAQIVAAMYYTRVNRVVTFQSPGVNSALAEQFAKADKPEAHHYRVAGDIVPVAGNEMLPGSIQYFTRAVKNKGKKKFESAVNVTASHVAFPLTTLLQSQDPATLTDEQRTLLKFGAHDRGEVEEGLKARMMINGIYGTEKDPRKNFEWARANIGPALVEGVMGYNSRMAQANLGYNLLLEACGPELRRADTYKKFKAFCDWLKGVKELHLSQRQEKFLAQELHLV